MALASLAFASGCGESSEASYTTVEATAAPTTTVATTTTVVTTTVSATTAVAATVATSTAANTAVSTAPEQPGLIDVDTVEDGSVEADVLARLADYTAAEARCFEGPSDCDAVALANEFGDGPEGSLGQYTIALIEGWKSAGYHVRDAGQITRRVRELAVPSPETVVVVECFRNAAVLVGSDDNVVDDVVGHGEKFMEWSKRDDRWIITSFSFSKYDAESVQAESCGL